MVIILSILRKKLKEEYSAEDETALQFSFWVSKSVIHSTTD